MIYNRPRAGKKKQLTWYFNKTIPIKATAKYTATFVCNGTYYSEIYYVHLFNGSEMYYTNESMRKTVYTSGKKGWVNESYRTITFETEPTGDLLTWLQANATPQ